MLYLIYILIKQRNNFSNCLYIYFFVFIYTGVQKVNSFWTPFSFLCNISPAVTDYHPHRKLSVINIL